MKPRRRDFARALLRSFSIQGSWTCGSLLGPGLAHALSPLLVRIYADDPPALQAALHRHSRPFNAHPYLAPVAIGALARMEFAGGDPDTVTRLRSALQAPLGALGDEAVWTGWRPFCAFGATLAFLCGTSPIAVAVAFVFVYNLGHIALRLWGLRTGWQAGREVASALRRSLLKRAGKALVSANHVLIGASSMLLAGRIADDSLSPWVVAGALGAALGCYLLPPRSSGIAVAALFAAWGAWLL